MPEFKIVETTVSDKVAELFPLLQLHRDELATNKALMELAPNVDAYRALEQSGALLALVAYREEEIVGYSINFIGQHMHYSGLRYAHNDALYVAPEHRGGRLGLRLMRETERLAKEKGARMMMWHAKTDTTLEKLMTRTGYAVQDIIFSKEII
ncbi:MAG TPA: GNAT family N-acetyltransferase [Gallionellaceae bacterium]